MPVCELETSDKVVTPSCEEPAVGLESPAAARPALRRGYRWALGALLAVACLAAGFILTSVLATPTRIEPLPFGFQLEQRDDRVALNWNPAAEAIHHATRATLTIQDGPETEDVELNLAALRLGGLIYDPIFRNVRFRLVLAIPSRRTVSEEARLSLRP
jgi:hypothetical protein